MRWDHRWALCLVGVFVGALLGSASGQRPRATEAAQVVAGGDRGDLTPLALPVPGRVRAIVEQELARVQSGRFSRDDLLVMLGRSAAASGQFEVSSAAYLMFLDNFGPQHPYAERIYLRLIDSLAPLDLRSAEVSHTAEGPQYHPVWKMGADSDGDTLAQAAAVCWYAVEHARRPGTRAQALSRLGWIERARGEWGRSTEAWERCAATAGGTRLAADALWLTAENLEWTGQPQQAADRLREFIQTYSDDARVAAAAIKTHVLETAAQNEEIWLADPAAGQQGQITTEGTDGRSPHEIYRCVARRLQREQRTQALLAAARWAVGQEAWPEAARVAARWDLVDAVLEWPNAPEEARQEAIAMLEQLAALTHDEHGRVRIALAQSELLAQLGRVSQALAVLQAAEAEVEPLVCRPRLIVEHIQLLLDAGQYEAARGLFLGFADTYPEHPKTAEFGHVFGAKH